MCINTNPPLISQAPAISGLQQQQMQQRRMANTVNTELMKQALSEVLRGFLPHVCNKHVYRFEHRQKYSTTEDVIFCYCKWTFFNDLDVKLRLRVNNIKNCSHVNLTELREHITVDHEDYEAWMADAIMRCEAGEDIWERPKRDPLGGLAWGHWHPGQMSAAQVRAQQQQYLQRMQNSLAASSSGLVGGVFGGLGQSIFGK